MKDASYRILDEPGSRNRGLPALNPFWPLLGMMFGGAWLGAAMFAFNAAALRGPTIAREIGLAISILAGSVGIVFVIGVALDRQLLGESAIKYALLLVVAWKFGLAYWIYFLQQSSYALYEYFGNPSNSQFASLGPAIVIFGSFAKSSVLSVHSSPFWTLMVS